MYTVWDGKKFKGVWADRVDAVDYMALRDKSERDAWTLMRVTDAGLSDQIEERAQEIAAEKASRPPATHHLKAVSVESGTKV